MAGAAGTAALSGFTTAESMSGPRIKLGVTLYSYTGDYGVTTMLEDCLADAAAMKVEGIELLSETHIPDYPNPAGRWVERWHGLMDKYRTQPSCYNCRVNSRLRNVGTLSGEGFLEPMLQDMKLAKRLGFRIMRPAWGVETPERMSAPAWGEIARRALPYAEKCNVKLAVEINSRRAVDLWMELIAKTKTRHLGLLVDMGMREDSSCLSNEVMENPQNILPYLPHMFHIRGRFHGPYTFSTEGKCWATTQGLQAESVAYSKLVPVLVRGGYNGYISSEYEGPRNVILASNHLGGQNARLRQALGLA
jgi:hypothetical protein